jgi:hypothetical protein
MTTFWNFVTWNQPFNAIAYCEVISILLHSSASPHTRLEIAVSYNLFI